MIKPFIFGHRGCAYEPENTILAFRKAIDLGVDGIEFDVRRCKSGEIVVIHDEKVDRTTNGKGYVKDLSLSELKKLDAGKGEKVPTFEEVADFVKSAEKQNAEHIKLVVELKDENLEKDVAKIIQKYDLYESAAVISFYHEYAKKIKKIEGKIKTGILFVGNPVNVVSFAKEANADFLFPNFYYVDENLVESAHANNLKVFVWNVDDVENLSKMLKAKVDGIGSNKPDVVAEYLNK